MTSESLPVRLNSLRGAICDAGLDALLITDITNVGYITGFSGSSANALVSANDALLITDARYTLRAREECPHVTVAISANSDSYPNTLREYCLSEPSLQIIGCESTRVTLSLWHRLQDCIPGVQWKPTENLVERLRSIKDADEVCGIRAAIRVGEEAFLSVKPLLRASIAERDFAIELEYAMRQAGADSPAFETIVASGPQSADPHHFPNGRRLTPGDWVIVDWGAKVVGYCSDLTRTFLVGPAVVSEEQQRAFSAVREAQQVAFGAIRTGKIGKVIDALARQHIASAGYGEKFSHSLGHQLGRAVHDGLALSVHASNVTLQRGMVLTVEPGIYDENWGGIRIEDDILVTHGGCEVLSHLPRELEILG